MLQWKLKYNVVGCLVYYTNNIPSHAFLFTNTSIYTNAMTSRKMVYYRDGEQIIAYKNHNRVTLKTNGKSKVIYLVQDQSGKIPMCSSDLFRDMLKDLYTEDKKRWEKNMEAKKTPVSSIDKESLIQQYLLRLSSAAPFGLTSYTCTKTIIHQSTVKLSLSLLGIKSTRSGMIGCILSAHRSLTTWKHTLLFTQNELYSNMFVNTGVRYIPYSSINKVTNYNDEMLEITYNRGSKIHMNLIEHQSLFGSKTVIYSAVILKEMIEKLAGIA